MTKHLRILNIIYNLKMSHPTMIDIFTKGSCVNFFFILRSIFPEAEAYYDGEHVITKIDDYYYDITGKVLPKQHIPLRNKKAVSQMARYTFQTTTEQDKKPVTYELSSDGLKVKEDGTKHIKQQIKR